MHNLYYLISLLARTSALRLVLVILTGKAEVKGMILYSYPPTLIRESEFVPRQVYKGVKLPFIKREGVFIGLVSTHTQTTFLYPISSC